jgi:hypothetical protein
MAILQAILAELFNYVGTILNTALGWATIMLFGKVPKDRQLYVTLSTLGAMVWLIALIGVAFPAVAIFILSFVRLSSYIGRFWVRIAMAALVIVTPALVGFDSLYTMPTARRPKTSRDRIKAILKGYPYTAGLAITVVTMFVFAPAMQVRNMIRRWTAVHIPMIVESHNYLAVVDSIQKTLDRNGVKTRRTPSSPMLRLPTKLLTLMAGGVVHGLIADNLTTLVSPELEIMLHPSDLVVRGKEANVAHAHSIIAERLGFTKAYMTWDQEANDLEDRMSRIWRDVVTERVDPATAQAQLDEIEGKLREIHLAYDEWEVLLREKLLIEHEMLLRMLGRETQAREAARDEESHEHSIDSVRVYARPE